jgi:hypothetical protein
MEKRVVSCFLISRAVCVKTTNKYLTRLVLCERINERNRAVIDESTVGRGVLSGLAAKGDLRGGFCGETSKTPPAG